MIGFIGMGNMARAIIGGIISSGQYSENQIYGSAKTKKTLENISKLYNINISDNINIAKNCKIIFICVKPNIYEEVLHEIKDFVKDKIVISIAPLKTIAFLRENTYNDLKCVSSMPNTPALVKEGMSAISFSDNINDKEKSMIINLFTSFGEVEVIDEYLMNAVVAVSGSAPAYVYLFIEALADGAVKYGMNRKSAYKFAAQTVLGSGKMILETGEHPSKLKDDVCSPGGTTIEAVQTLNQRGFQGIIMEAMDSCINKIKS
ncbi:MAG: pyrroline-5-carboxylate reductase [Lachnospirales bacterium]